MHQPEQAGAALTWFPLSWETVPRHREAVGDRPVVQTPHELADSLAVTWDGLTEERNPVQSGRYTLRVAPRAAGAGQLARQLSLEILRAKPDTQPWPAGAGLAEGTPLPLPSSSSGPAVRSLAEGLAAA